MLEIRYVSKGRIVAEDQSSRDIMQKGFIGEAVKTGKPGLGLSIYEALYLMDVRNAACASKNGKMTYNQLASKHWKAKKFMAKYFTYKDWRDRGLIIKEPASRHKEPNKTPIKGYPSSSLQLPRYELHGVFFQTDLTTVIDSAEEAKRLYEAFWFGQYGSYKAADRGKLNKLDIYETLFLMERGILAVENTGKKELVRQAASRRREFMLLYEVYKDWRDRGYVIKTGFKFGTHFRVYFPGAKPVKQDEKTWVHSKHVIHVFPRESRLLTSEWARAIRVAHSVRKTFILAVPGKKEAKKVEIDFILYHRKGGDAENPESSAPKYAMLSLGEEEYLGGAELAGAIREAKNRKLELVIAIADRETAVTYYKVRQITLPGSVSEYYEIDWMQP
ncbi:MAG TPA: tRNA-intron lyase [Candidatus Saccharimonadales bacterium]|nr:tRNA-intron lyase [Candidatus Saccharimonadales bacterium]